VVSAVRISEPAARTHVEPGDDAAIDARAVVGAIARQASQLGREAA
jgi:hypothetical protein